MKSKHNWKAEMEKILSSFSEKPNLLLHSCCAPCSSYVIKYLLDKCHITVFYYNPNIYPQSEYIKRFHEQKRLLEILGVDYVEASYNPFVFEQGIKGLEFEPEGGERCKECFRLRLYETAKTAKKLHFDLFSTTLSVSPHKNADLINSLSVEIGTSLNIQSLLGDFKKNNGYNESIQLSKSYNLYRQGYCGCIFSLT